MEFHTFLSPVTVYSNKRWTETIPRQTRERNISLGIDSVSVLYVTTAPSTLCERQEGRELRAHTMVDVERMVTKDGC